MMGVVEIELIKPPYRTSQMDDRWNSDTHKLTLANSPCRRNFYTGTPTQSWSM
jgi:hypothetical protein